MQVTFRHERLKEARMKKNMTQEMLAECCNTSDRYIRDLERGRKSHLEIPMEELVDMEQEKEP